MPWFYYVIRFTLRLLLYILTRWEVKGRENIPEKGPLLVISNHLSLADPPLLNFTLNRPVRYMAKKQLFRFKIMGYCMRGIGAFPVRRGQVDRNAIRQSEQVLAEGLVLVIFPEGTRSRSAQLQQAYPGPALIALRSGAPILPIGISGTDKLEHGFGILTRPRVTINIGNTFHLTPNASKLPRTELITDMMEHIADLLPPSYHGIYKRQAK